jgi:hypothetical protein
MTDLPMDFAYANLITSAAHTFIILVKVPILPEA